MRKLSFVFSMLIGVVMGIESLSASDSDTAKIFYQINEKSCLVKLKLAIQQSSLEPIESLNGEKAVADYLKKNREALQFLYQAADMPRVDFGCYNEAVKPEIIPVVSQTPRCIRLLMCDFSYNVLVTQGTKSGRSLIAALRIVQLTSGIPYLYGQLLLSSNIRIVFDGVRAMDFKQGDSHKFFSGRDVQEILSLLNSLEKDLSTGYQTAFQREAELKKIYLEEYLRPRLKNANQLDELIARYKAFYSFLSKSFFSPSDAVWTRIMDEAESINHALTEPVITPRKWQQRYLESMEELKMLKEIFDARKSLSGENS